MRQIIRGAVFAAVALSLGACGSTGIDEALGYGKQPPDEFAIVTKAPLTIPPDFSLRPPEPGAPPRQSRSPQELAIGALYPNRASGSVTSQALGAPGETSGEVALLNKAGATNADPEIRRLIESEYHNILDKDESFANRIIFWRDTSYQGVPVDASAEAQRLRENDALGNPVTDGETPRIEPEEKGFLEGLF